MKRKINSKIDLRLYYVPFPIVFVVLKGNVKQLSKRNNFNHCVKKIFVRNEM